MLPSVPEPSEPSEPHEHEFTIVRSGEASCETEGFVEYECECGETKNEVIAPVGHDYEVIMTETSIVEKCKNCGKENVVNADNTDNNANDANNDTDDSANDTNETVNEAIDNADETVNDADETVDEVEETETTEETVEEVVEEAAEETVVEDSETVKTESAII